MKYPEYKDLIVALLNLGLQHGSITVNANRNNTDIFFNDMNVGMEEVERVLSDFNMKKEEVDEQNINYYGETHVKGIETWRGMTKKGECIASIDYISIGDVNRNGRTVNGVYLQCEGK